MDIQDHQRLKQAAGDALSQAEYSPKKLILLHTGVIFLVSALLSLLDALLTRQIGAAGGLSGLGTRSMLTTVQSVLQLAQTAALPFWQIGYLFAALQLSRRKRADSASLLEGFRRFGPVLRLKLVQLLLYGGIALVSVYAGAFLYFLTPWSSSLMTQLLYLMMDSSLMADPNALQAAILTAMEGHTAALAIFSFLVFLCGCAPFFYRYRLADLLLMDNPANGALSAMRASRKMMKGSCLNMLKLDLSFWWFYLLDGLAMALCYGDLLLNTLGMTLPGSAEAQYFAFLAVSLSAQLVLYWWRKNEVTVTYANAYASLLAICPEEAPPLPEKQFRS